MDSPSESEEETEETKMKRNWGVPKPMFYDDIDIRNAYSSGFWIGSIAGGGGVALLCFLVGLFIYT